MNTLLETLFDKYYVSPKDRYEIYQIFDLLPSSKKQNLLNNFEALSIRLQKIETDLNIEKQILIGTEVEHIKTLVLGERK